MVSDDTILVAVDTVCQPPYLCRRARSPDETGADARGSRTGNSKLANSGCHDNAVVGRDV
jgi:hypothetical protein